MSSISRCSPGGQPGGGGSRKSCSIAFSTWELEEEYGEGKLLQVEGSTLLGKRVGWDQGEHEVIVGKELKNTGNSHEIIGWEWISEWRSQNV